MKTNVLVILVTVLVLVFTGCRPTQQTAPSVTQSVYADYAGSEACAGCHGTIYSKFIQSGHPYKLNKVWNGQKPMNFPFTTLPDIPNAFGLSDGDNTLGPPSSYADVSYVIGGYYWKARFVDTNGFIITGSDVQYNYETNGWVAYHDDETDKPYNCGKCHTTAWIPFEDGGLRKDGLPGMDGNFFAGGVHCEECHGPGAAHVNSNGDPRHITKDESAEMCGRCHTRDSQNRIAAKGGLIKHHEQYDELLGLNPDNPGAGGIGKHLAAGIGCNVCHDPHTSTVYQQRTGIRGVIRDCEECHPDRVIAAGAAHSQEQLLAKGLLLDKPSGRKITNCIACHMPEMSKSAVSHGPVGTGPLIGDINSHIFKIDLSTTQQFTADGKLAYPWITGQYACRKCHNGEYFFDLTMPSGIVIHK
ncbi:MAG: hypothetical protein GY940_16895 [bacterium]|nr:hypothetical protein [bacterium]